MSEPNQTNPSPDDLLADFTDRVLNGEFSGPGFSPDAELHSLEETVVRMKQTLPEETLDEKALKRMQADFKVRARKAAASTSPVWSFLRPHPRFALAFAAMITAILVIALPLLTSTGGPVHGTAGIQSQGLILLAGIGCVIVLLIWVKRRK